MSLFNRPAWAKSHSTEAKAEDDNIFSHSTRSYRDIVAEQERKKKEKLERKKAKEERRSSGKREIKEEPSANGNSKRRRITIEDGEALLKCAGLPSTSVIDSQGEDWGPVVIDDDAPVRRSPRNRKIVGVDSPRKAAKPLRATEVIEIGEDGEEEEIAYEPQIEEKAESADESDDEFAELARKARRERQQNEALDRKSQPPSTEDRTPTPIAGPSTSQHDRPDPAVQILVTSPIPNTNPLIVHRKLSQRLQEIRQVWCSKQGFSKDFSDGVFFVYRMRRVYDATTCRSLGLDIDAFGNIVLKGAEGKEGVEKVHLEAMTEEVLREAKKEREREKEGRGNGEIPIGDGDASAGVQQEAGEEAEGRIRLILKAKTRKDFKIIVKPVSCALTSSVQHQSLTVSSTLLSRRLQMHIAERTGSPQTNRSILNLTATV
jgi:hypothetical protein